MDEIETLMEIDIGEPAFIIYPGSEYMDERKVSFTVHGIDYLSYIDIEGPTANENHDFLVVDLEVKNVGEHDINPETHYPRLVIHNDAGQKFDFRVYSQVRKSNSFKYIDLIPGGHSGGLVISDFEKGEMNDSLYYKSSPSGFNNAEPPGKIQGAQVSEVSLVFGKWHPNKPLTKQ